MFVYPNFWLGIVFVFSWDHCKSAKRNWKQCLCKIWVDKQRILWYFPKWGIHVFQSIQATRMQIAFGKLLALIFIVFSRRKGVFSCWRWFYLLLSEKVFLFHCKCCIKRDFHPKNLLALQYSFVWLKLSEYVDNWLRPH